MLSEIKYGGLHGLCALDHLGERVQAALGALPQRVDLSRQGASRGSSVGQCWGGWEDAREEAGELASRTRPSSKTEPSGSASNADTSSAVSRSPRLPAATDTQTTPGAGAYAESDAHRHTAPSYTIGSRRADRVQLAGPGPTMYDHQQPYLKARHSSAPATSLKGRAASGSVLTSARKQPGPGSYAASELTRRGEKLMGSRAKERWVRPLGTRPPPASASSAHVRHTAPKMHPITAKGESYAANVAKAASYLAGIR